MNRFWPGPDREPTEAAPVTVGPRSTVPRPAHARLRETLVNDLGLEDGCTDDAIITHVLLLIDEREAAKAGGIEVVAPMHERTAVTEIEAEMNDPDAWGEPGDAPPPRPRSERRQRAAVVSVRLNETELATVQGYASSRGLSLSGALRTAALEAATPLLRSPL